VTKPLFLDGTPAAITFIVFALTWWVFEGVMRMVQRFRSTSRTLFNRDTSILVVGVFLAGGVIAGELIARHNILRWPGGPTWPLIVGTVLVALALALRSWSIYTLGRFFQYQIEIQSGHRVVDTGPYRYVRHPSYSAILLGLAGLGFACGSVLSLVATVGLGAIGLAVRIRAEEKQLTEALGQDYEAFAATHKRLIPHVL
jgi:protein-S-isoprenylcysteine O-methyltransferase Ste14